MLEKPFNVFQGKTLPEILATLSTRKVNLLNGYVRPMIEAYHILPPSRWQIT